MNLKVSELMKDSFQQPTKKKRKNNNKFISQISVVGLYVGMLADDESIAHYRNILGY